MLILLNEFSLVLIVLPISTFLISLVMQIILHKKIWVVGIVFLLYLLSTFTIFNSTFLFWVFIYTFIALAGTILADLLIRIKKG